MTYQFLKPGDVSVGDAYVFTIAQITRGAPSDKKQARTDAISFVAYADDSLFLYTSPKNVTGKDGLPIAGVKYFNESIRGIVVKEKEEDNLEFFVKKEFSEELGEEALERDISMLKDIMPREFSAQRQVGLR